MTEKIKNFWKNWHWPTWRQWHHFWRICSWREKYALVFFSLIALTGAIILGAKFYLSHTNVVPGYGGSLSIAIIGQPRFLNPVLSQINNPDRDLSLVFFSSLMKYDTQGNLVPDLAQSYEIKDGGKTYDITLKNNLKWHDGQPLSVDDVIFTLQTIQDSNYKSPLRALWQGAQFSKINETAIRFQLSNPYAPFLHTLTFGILPKHIWVSVSPSSFALHELNLKPIGSGPYKFSKLSKDNTGKILTLEADAFNQYFLGLPHIAKIIFHFYDSEDEAINAYKKGEVNMLNFISEQTKKEIESQNPDWTVYSIKLPRYYAIFFNQTQNTFLADKKIRQALAAATNKTTIAQQVLGNDYEIVNSPLIEGMTGFSDDTQNFPFDLQNAKNLLFQAGWKFPTPASSTASSTISLNSTSTPPEEGILRKDGKNLEITLTTNDWPDLVQTAQIIQQQWQQIGVKVNLDIKNSADIQNAIIRPRQYQALLFGEVLGLEPDPFSFWHSSQQKDPGLNLALYSNQTADQLLVEARKDMNKDSRADKYRQFSKLVAADLPAIFLYSPYYLFATSQDIKGIEIKNLNNISSYWSEINTWYMRTIRAWK